MRDAQSFVQKTLVQSLDKQFARLHQNSIALVTNIPAEQLYRKPRESAGAFPIYSCGEHLLRSAASVEQTFGGITTNLWDDPFEWTLPETLNSASRVAEYLGEVEATRQRAFELFTNDSVLAKEIVVPSGETQTLCALLTETLARAAHHQGRAYATFRFFSDERLPQ
ncbi:MAG: hypothetical protein WBP93_10390 [Pyrinomonadaceae bacterium]